MGARRRPLPAGNKCKLVWSMAMCVRLCMHNTALRDIETVLYCRGLGSSWYQCKNHKRLCPKNHPGYAFTMDQSGNVLPIVPAPIGVEGLTVTPEPKIDQSKKCPLPALSQSPFFGQFCRPIRFLSFRHLSRRFLQCFLSESTVNALEDRMRLR